MPTRDVCRVCGRPTVAHVGPGGLGWVQCTVCGWVQLTADPDLTCPRCGVWVPAEDGPDGPECPECGAPRG